MKKLISKIVALALIVTVAMSLTIPVSADAYRDATIVFTHDLHSHFLPSTDESGNQYGGYARLAQLIKGYNAMYPSAIVVDGGDFSMGSLFQTAFATNALELRIMGEMGYDVTTFGNHEFDYLPKGLASMLNVAKENGNVPEIVDANYLPPVEGDERYTSDSALMWDALDNYGVKPYTIMERGGVYYAVIGIYGKDADDCAPNSGMIFEDPIAVAQRTVDAAVAECKEKHNAEPLVICLSHSGTENGEGEDYELAKGVNGIDVIISGHTHTTLDEPIVVNDTYIFSVGEYGKNLGLIELRWSSSGNVEFKNYSLHKIDENISEDPEIAALVESYKNEVETNYLANYGVTFDQVLVNNPYQFETQSEITATQHESAVTNIYSDAYKWAVEQATGEKVDMAVTAAGVVRESLPTGDITVSDVFNAASLGVGTEGELVSVYLTGKELKSAIEVDATVQPLMTSAQLYCSGVEYSFNTSRMLFNKVDYAMLRNDDGTLSEIEDDKLYRVVTGMYAGGMLGNVKETSFGLISITPKDKDGNPIDMSKLSDYVVRDKNGNPLKEWYAISSYLMNMGGTMDEQYASTDGRKIVYSSLNPVKLLKGANVFTYALLGIIAVLVLIVVAIVKLLTYFKHKKCAK